MSKSKRRVPYIRQERKDTRLLNRQVRYAKLAEIPSGAYYRKMFSAGWDWSYIWTREQAMQDYYDEHKSWIREEYTLEQWMEAWERWALRK